MASEHSTSAYEIATQRLLKGRELREVEPGLYSALPETEEAQHYDRLAGIYDRLIGSRLYNRWMWGSDLRDYTAFADAALRSATSGPYLDAGCGSMLFTAEVYRQAQRPVIAMDHSLEMLRRARARLQQGNGSIPANVVLIQADLHDLPFQAASFATVLSMGMLHLFEDGGAMLRAVRSLLLPRGRLYLNTLVLNQRWGDHYLRFLHRRDEVAALRTVEDVRVLITATTDHVAECRAVGNIAYAIAGIRAG